MPTLEDTLISVGQLWEEAEIDAVFNRVRCLMGPSDERGGTLRLPFSRVEHRFVWSILPTAAGNPTTSDRAPAQAMVASGLHLPRSTGDGASSSYAVTSLRHGPPSQLNVSTDTPAERVLDGPNVGSSHPPDANHHEARLTAMAEALYETVQAQRGNGGSVVINLEELPPTADAPGAHNNLVTLAQVVSDQPAVSDQLDPETLRRYHRVVVSVRGGFAEAYFQGEAMSLLRRISRSSPRMATYQTIRAVVNHLHGEWTYLRARSKS